MVNNNKITSFVNALNGLVDGKEDVANKVTSITSSSTNTHYPTAKAVYDALAVVTASSGGNYIYDFYHDPSTDDIVLEYDSASGGGSSGGSSVDIVTAWETTPSDSKVASEKLTKDTLDTKLDNALSSSTVSVETGDSILFTDYNDGNKIKKTDKILATQVKDSVAHSTIGTGVNATQYAINDAIDTALGNKVSKSSTSGLLKNDGSVDTSAYITSSALSNYVQKSNTTGLLKNDGTVMTSGTASTNYSAGNHTHSGYVSATKVTSWSSTVSDSNVPSEKLVKNYIDEQIGTAIQYIQQ